MKHRVIPLVILAVVIAVVVLLSMAVDSFLRYSPYEDPGAFRTGMWLATAGLLLAMLPAGMLLAWAGWAALRRYGAWKGRLTPRQQEAMCFAEVALLEEAHLTWRHHNQQEDARLTESVMGTEGSRDGEWQ